MMQNLFVVINSLSALATFILVVALLNRNKVEGFFREIALSVTLGLCAYMVLMEPLRIAPGIQVDGRNLFVGISAVICTPLGILITGAIVAVARLYIGGIGVTVGLASLVVCVVAGVTWRWLDKRSLMGKTWRWPIFGGLLCLSIPTLLMLPSPLGYQAFFQGAPFQVIIYVIGAILIGLALDHEFSFVSRFDALQADAEVDPLTNALNRRGLKKLFNQQLSASSTKTVLVAMIDVDRFKSINDRFGHDVGDQALLKIVATIKQNVRSSDLLARVGGDEFTVVAIGLNAEQAHAFYSKLEKVLKSELRLTLNDGKLELPLSASVGMTFNGTATGGLDSFLAAADAEMMAHKRNNR